MSKVNEAYEPTDAPYGLEPSYSQGLNAHYDNITPSINRISVHYPQTANALGSPKGATLVTSNHASIAYNTPQS
jgi:hypothetical protein